MERLPQLRSEVLPSTSVTGRIKNAAKNFAEGVFWLLAAGIVGFAVVKAIAPSLLCFPAACNTLASTHTGMEGLMHMQMPPALAA